MAPTLPYQQEQTDQASGSLGQHIPTAIPPIPSTSSTLPPPRQPSVFNGQIYHNLPANLAADLQALPPLPVRPQRRGCRPVASVLAPTAVSFSYLILSY